MLRLTYVTENYSITFSDYSFQSLSNLQVRYSELKISLFVCLSVGDILTFPS